MTAPITLADSTALYRLTFEVERLADEQAQLVVEMRATRERIYGNGKPGLISELSSVNHKVDSILVGIANRDKIAFMLVGLIVPLVVGLLWQIFTGQIKLTP